jgi:hypothetical protein
MPAAVGRPPRALAAWIQKPQGRKLRAGSGHVRAALIGHARSLAFADTTLRPHSTATSRDNARYMLRGRRRETTASARAVTAAARKTIGSAKNDRRTDSAVLVTKSAASRLVR